MKAAVSVGLGLVVLGGLGFWVLDSRAKEERKKLTENHVVVADELAETRAERDRFKRELAAVIRERDKASVELDESRNELAGVKQSLEQERASLATAEAALEAAKRGELPEPDTAKPGTAFQFANLEEALAKVDWNTVGNSMGKMPGLIQQLAQAVIDGKELTDLPPDLLGNVQKYNAPLVTTAMGLVRDGVPGTGINGSFSHPGFMLNALFAALDELNQPLTDAQTKALDQIGQKFVQRDERRLADYRANATELRKITDESDLKRTFFREVYEVLTTEQHDALRPEASRGRLQLDIFSESLMWTGRAGPLPYPNETALAMSVGDWVMSRGRLPAERRDAVHAVVGEWADSLPSAVLGVEQDAFDKLGMLHVDHVGNCAREVAKLLRLVIDELALDDAASAGVRAIPGSVVFYRSP